MSFLVNVTLEMVDLFPLYLFHLSHHAIAVPVVVVFTKCDALSAMAMGKLTPKGKQLPQVEQLAKTKEYMKEMLRNCTAWERLKTSKHSSKACVYLECKSRDFVVL